MYVVDYLLVVSEDYWLVVVSGVGMTQHLLVLSVRFWENDSVDNVHVWR